MRADWARGPTLALAALLACCRSEPPPAASRAASAPIPSACRVGPDGAALRADRGIGGTGSPIVTVDRGIGGTGAPATTSTFADRGIGGTGIIGVITGFASVCLAGQEVALPPGVPVAIGEQPAPVDALRAGQVAVIEASGDTAGLRARRIVIRYEAVGPVERLAGDTARVAGQDVALSPQTWGERPGVGDWVAVSGLRRSDAVIEASRVERMPRGRVLVHGRLVEEQGGLRVGAQPVRRDPPTVALIGQEVTLTGMIGSNGELLPFSITPDLLVIDPAAFFGPRVNVVVIESFGVLDGGRLRLAPGFSAPAPGLRLDGSRRSIFRFERTAGGLRATSLADRPTGFATPPRFEPARRFEPAPMPNRAIGGPNVARPDRAGSPGGARGDSPRSRFGRDRPDSPSSFGAANFGQPGDGGPPRGR